jgi:Mrp family chromosome partitioning ATPase
VQIEEQINGTPMPLASNRSNGHRRHNLQLLLANLQNSTQRLRGGAAIAFTSASSGEGVSHVAQLFAVELARHTGRRTLIVSAERMQSLGVEYY